jgi:hypothetical protein
MAEEFYRVTRIGDDNCGLTQDLLQNNNTVDYMLKNFYAADCTMRKPIEFATRQVDVNFVAAGGDGKTCGIGGCNINESNSLLFSVPTHLRARINLLQRPYLTVPYLGRGKFDSQLEGKLMKSEYVENKKTVNPASELNNSYSTNYPLLPSIQKTITNPRYLVEDWTRGGDSTRNNSVQAQIKSM